MAALTLTMPTTAGHGDDGGHEPKNVSQGVRVLPAEQNTRFRQRQSMRREYTRFRTDEGSWLFLLFPVDFCKAYAIVVAVALTGAGLVTTE